MTTRKIVSTSLSALEYSQLMEMIEYINEKTGFNTLTPSEFIKFIISEYYENEDYIIK